MLTTENGRFYVNAKTGDVELASIYDRIKNSSCVRLTQDEALKQALNIARKNYRDFDRLDMQLDRSELLDHGDAGKEYLFEWVRKVDDVTITANRVCITLNPCSGEMTSYISVNMPVIISPVPSPVISKEMADTIAISQFNDTGLACTGSRLYLQCLPEGTQSLIWVVSVHGEFTDTDSHADHAGGDVTIDAVTGKVLAVNPCM